MWGTVNNIAYVVGGAEAEPVRLREDPGGDGADAGEGQHSYKNIFPKPKHCEKIFVSKKTRTDEWYAGEYMLF